MNLNTFFLPHLPTEQNTSDLFFIEKVDGKDLYGILCNQPPTHRDLSLIPLRDILATEEPLISSLICKTKHLLHWHKDSLYSGCCGTPTELSSTEIAKICLTCKKISYPHYANFVLVLIEKGDKLLLARSPHFSPGMYSTIAGFVNPGESYEDAVRRETHEELGIAVEQIRYFGSQHWPFPASMATAFIATYASGQLLPDPTEIEDAQWFAIDSLPPLPHLGSISRQIIDHYVRNFHQNYAIVP